MEDSVLILERFFDKEEFAAANHESVAVVEIGRDNHVGNAGLVFHRDEDEHCGCTGPLPRDHTSLPSAHLF